MFFHKDFLNSNENKLYNKIVTLSRNKLFYIDFLIEDSFQNRVNLIFLHISFLFNKVKEDKNTHLYKKFYQKIFDIIFNKIEINLRELGFGDVTVNKNMKYLVKIFYDILLNCEKYNDKNLNQKNLFLNKYITLKAHKKGSSRADLSLYFDKYHSFCLDLNANSVLKGEIDFIYI